MKKIFFVTYGGGHVNTLLPIIKEIKRKKLYIIEILALTTSVSILKNNGIEYKTVKDYITDEEINVGKSVVQDFHVDGKALSYDDTVAYYGVGFKELIDKYGYESAYKKLYEEGRKSFLPIEFMKRIIKSINPDLVIATSSPRMEEAALIASCNLNIPCIRIEQFFATRECNLPSDVLYCVMEELTKTRILNRGVNDERVIITGQPAFDQLAKIKDNKVEVIRSKYGIKKSDKLLLFAGQQTTDKITILNKILEIEKNNEDLFLILKPHPNEDINIYYNAVREKKSSAIIIRDDLHSLIMESDLVIIEFSTVGLETIFLDKDLITVNITGKRDIAPYAESGAAISVNKIDNLEKIIKMVLNDKDVKIKLKKGREKFHNDGKASVRILNVIKNILCET